MASGTSILQQPYDPEMPIFFYMPNDKSSYGCFSQWYKSSFTVPKDSFDYLHRAHHSATLATRPMPSEASTATDESIPSDETLVADLSTLTLEPSAPTEMLHFTCCEQYMMYAKALYFSSPHTASLILASPHPRDQKALGRQTPNYSDALWDRVCWEVVFRGNMAQYRQNAGLKRILLGTGERELVEAARDDAKWGIGFGETEAREWWRAHKGEERREGWGRNWLGKALMRVREALREMKMQNRSRRGDDGVEDAS
ncbi:hypothetical protein LTS18_010506 [Coniosporium uncinatum]|uniref:Uncharacterized protein n=1 Tax=Coniosporium uncinatum TaxID=93489 RepID=A0ACC3CZC5_9PEZI|nr:hypothetical protein LTS18_010506 [Coniosporium uncinatum]